MELTLNLRLRIEGIYKKALVDSGGKRRSEDQGVKRCLNVRVK